jgi:hypothetical protein
VTPPRRFFGIMGSPDIKNEKDWLEVYGKKPESEKKKSLSEKLGPLVQPVVRYIEEAATGRREIDPTAKINPLTNLLAKAIWDLQGGDSSAAIRAKQRARPDQLQSDERGFSSISGISHESDPQGRYPDRLQRMRRKLRRF